MYRLFLTARYLVTRPINLLGMFGVTLGVWALIVVVAIFTGFLEVVGAHVKSAAADVSVQYLPPSASYAVLQQAIESDPGVVASAPRVVHFGLLHRPGARPATPPLLGRSALQGGDTPFQFVIGVDPAQEATTTSFRDWLLDVPEQLRVRDPDAPLQPIDGRPAVLIGKTRMLDEGLRPGDLVTLTTGQVGNGGGRGLEQLEATFAVAGAFHTQHLGYEGNNTFVHVDELRALLGFAVPDAVHEIAVRVADERDARATAGRVERAVRAALRLEDQPASRGPIARTWRDRYAFVLSSIEWQRLLMKIVLVVIMVVAAVLMYATLSEMVAEKRSDIGILTAMGASPRGVTSVFLATGLSITLAGVALGTVLGCLSAAHLEDFRQLVIALFDVDLFPVKVYNLDRVPYALDPVWILQVAGMAIATGIVVAALPAWRAGRQDPGEVLRGN